MRALAGVMAEGELVALAQGVDPVVLVVIPLGDGQITCRTDGRAVHERPPGQAVGGVAPVQQIGEKRRRVEPIVHPSEQVVGCRLARQPGSEHPPCPEHAVIVLAFAVQT